MTGNIGNPAVNDSFKAMLVSGKQKKNPEKDWNGILVQITHQGTRYSGVIFPSRNTEIPADKNIVK